MPYIHTQTNAKITEEQKEKLVEALGKAISLIPGKSEEWLMLNTEGQCSMAFRGDSTTPCAMVDVQIFGKTTVGAYDALTASLCQTVSEILAIPADRIYVKYTELSHWGYNGFNF